MTHRLRSTDKEEIEELRKKLLEREKEIEKLKTEIALLPSSKFDLTEREKSIIEFITNNPGKSKEDIVKKLTQEFKGSRATIFKSIDKLETEDHIIVCKKEKPNSQIYKVYINEDSILLDTYNNLNNFKNNFIETIDRLLQDKNWNKNVQHKKFDLIISSLILVYIHTLNTYITYILLEWSNRFDNDNILLNKLFSLIFFNFVEINLKLIHSFQIPYIKPLTRSSTFKEITSPISKGFLYNQFLLKPHIILNILNEYQKNNLHSHIFPLLNSAWKISHPVYEYIRMFHPIADEIKLKPIGQVYRINADLSLLLLYYIRDRCSGFGQNIYIHRFSDPSLISPLFDKPLKRDEVFYNTMLLEAIGHEKHSELNFKFLVNEFIRIVERLHGLEYNRGMFNGWIKEHPNDKILEMKCLKYSKLVEKFVKIQYDNITNILGITISSETKSEGSIEFKEAINLDSLKSFFNEFNKYADLQKEISIAHKEIIDTACINSQNKS